MSLSGPRLLPYLHIGYKNESFDRAIFASQSHELLSIQCSLFSFSLLSTKAKAYIRS